MEKKTIIVTGIGGNVGQGIIRNIISTGYPVRIIGTNVTDFSAGNHWVDGFYKVPYGFDQNYIPEIIAIVKQEGADLIIPSTDFEAYQLSLHQEQIPCRIATTGRVSTGIYLDKYITWIKHTEFDIPFAETCLPSVYKNQFPRAIAKPRKGRGSKGLIWDVTSAKDLNDEEYLIQKIYEGTEITTAVYVRYTDKVLHGLITLERSLDNGATTFCKVITEYDESLMKMAQAMVVHFGLQGSFNIQSMATPDGQVIPFEINSRISGTNSIRSAFGFKDVQYAIEELLWNVTPAPLALVKGFAYRFLSDVIYPEKGESHSPKGNNTDHFIEF